MSEQEAKRAFQALLEKFERRRPIKRGLIGDSNGTVMVTSRPGWAYIRYRDDLNRLSTVRYMLPTQLADGTPVLVGRKYPEDSYEQVLDVDWTMYAWSPTTAEVAQHATPAVDLSDLSPGRVIPTDPASLLVNVRSFLYVDGLDAVEYGGGIFDLTGDVPGVAGHRLVLVYLDISTNSLATAQGTIVAVGTNADAPAVPENTIPLAVVDLANGETTIESDDISQYKILYDGVGAEVPLATLADYTRGYIIRGGAADWEAYDANGDGYALVGDGTDILSDLTPNWKGTHTWTVGNDESIVVEMDAALATDAMQFKDAGGVTSGFDERGVVFSNAGTLVSNLFAGDNAGNNTCTMGANVGLGSATLQDLTSGFGDIAVGMDAMTDMQNGTYNIAIGLQAMYVDTQGDYNVVLGGQAAYKLANGNRNIISGYQAGYNLVAVNGNVLIGHQAGYTTTGAGHIFIGQYAGYRQAAVNNYLIFDNAQRADAATELTHAIIYGVMGANPEDQAITFNVDLFTIGTDADSDVHLVFAANTNTGDLYWMEDENRFETPDDVAIGADSKALILGGSQDMDIGYDGTDGYIRTDLVAASDLNVDCGANKTLELQTPVWKDINLGAAMLSLPVATQPDEVQIVDELGANTGIYTWGFAVNELVSGVFEMQHDYQEGTDITFHVHWGSNTAPTGTDYVKWQLDYTIVRDDNTINAVTSIVVETAYDTQYEWIRSNFAAINGSTGGVDGGNIHIGDQFFFFLKRIAAVGDAFAGDALVATLGLHYQVDTLGSRQIGTK